MKSQSAPRRHGGFWWVPFAAPKQARALASGQPQSFSPFSPCLRGAFLALALAGACRKAEPPKAPKAVALSETPVADKAIADGFDDPAWIAGTWKKDGDLRWLLFNLPADVAELGGKPPRVLRRGKLSVHGSYVSAIFENGAYDLEATPLHDRLSGAPGTYRRGSPP